jgi:hypothetical protein
MNFGHFFHKNPWYLMSKSYFSGQKMKKFATQKRNTDNIFGTVFKLAQQVLCLSVHSDLTWVEFFVVLHPCFPE